MWKALYFKEWRLLANSSFFLSLALAWLILGWYFAAGVLEYQAMATQLAQLQNQRGATEMLLGGGQNMVQALMLAWSVFFGARTAAQEKQWHTHTLLRGVAGAQSQWLICKALCLAQSLWLLSVPYWIFTLYLTLDGAVAWDYGLIFAHFLGQLLLIIYATGMALTLSASQNQTLSASLLLAMGYLMLWLLPLFIQSPPLLTETLKFISPFEHLTLLQDGTISFMTLNFMILHLFIFITLTPLHWKQR